ncbi:MAG: nitroreductase [Pseudomonadota bacterium]
MLNEAVLGFLEGRKSLPLSSFEEPGPTEDQLNRILTIAARVPDHGRLEPWRFIVYRREHAAAIGERLLARAIEMRGPLADVDADRERNRLNRAPVAVGVVSSVNKEARIPEWEQFLSAGAVCMNLVSAAIASGFAANWITGWYSDDAEARALLGLQPHERMAGIIHIGSSSAAKNERPRPDMTQKVSAYSGPTTT